MVAKSKGGLKRPHYPSVHHQYHSAVEVNRKIESLLTPHVNLFVSFLQPEQPLQQG
jgi:hypothetical protein